MSTKYEQCPVCGKKGLRRTISNFYVGMDCKYCQSGWAIKRWSRGRWEPISPERIQQHIEQAKLNKKK